MTIGVGKLSGRPRTLTAQNSELGFRDSGGGQQMPWVLRRTSASAADVLVLAGLVATLLGGPAGRAEIVVAPVVES